jgi:hypothetical protein
MDNRLENLVWGSHHENVQDSIKHGTTTQGERGGMHKLTQTQVLEILERIKTEKITKEMADGYCVNPSTIFRIKSGERWKHLQKGGVR